jgi:cytochrome c oxidase cbb3-type subunit 3
MRRRLQNLTELLVPVVPVVIVVLAVVDVLPEAAAAQPLPATAATQQPASAAGKRPPANAVQLERGQAVFASQCGFCHGRDAMGGETGPDLTRSTLVRDDSSGNTIRQVVREGRVDKGMPALHVSDADLTAAIAYIKSQKAKSELPGARRSVDDADLETGSAAAGRQYFDGAGHCARCHSPTGDLAGLAKRATGLDLLKRMLYPANGRGATVSVTLPSGERVDGALAYRDEFSIALTEPSGRYRSWPATQVTFTVTNPLDAHAEQLGRYSDEDMHNVLAYLRTLR